MSFRDVEDLLAQRGVTGPSETVHGVVSDRFSRRRHLLRAQHQRLLGSRARATWIAVAAA